MRPRIAVKPFSLSLMSLLICAVMATSACTMYGTRPAVKLSDATGGESLERVFWKNIQTSNWVEVERSLASNYAGINPSGKMDRSTALEQYRTLSLKDFSIGDIKTELNGNTIVVTYSITLNGTAGTQPLPATPQNVMSVWQQQKSGWICIAHSVSQ